jgi:hypothetical protein
MGSVKIAIGIKANLGRTKGEVFGEPWPVEAELADQLVILAGNGGEGIGFNVATRHTGSPAAGRQPIKEGSVWHLCVTSGAKL